jgi:small subunit ribosomal protein S17
MNTQKKQPRILHGVVTSTAMMKTIVVAVTTERQHPKYLKSYRVTTKLKAHDESGKYHVGDLVTIQETRPLSKTKRWVILDKA